MRAWRSQMERVRSNRGLGRFSPQEIGECSIRFRSNNLRSDVEPPPLQRGVATGALRACEQPGTAVPAALGACARSQQPAPQSFDDKEA